MKWFHVFKNKSSIFTKTFISYVLIFTIPLAVLGAVSYYWAVSTLKLQTKENLINSLMDESKGLDSYFEAFLRYGVQLSQEDWVLDISAMKDYSFNDNHRVQSEIANYKSQLDVYKSNHQLIDTVAVYFPFQDRIISTEGLDTFSSFFEEIFTFKDISPAEWKNTFSARYVQKILPTSPVYNYNKNKKFITYISSLPMMRDNPRAFLILFIDVDALKNSLSNSVLHNPGPFCIVDAQNRLITGINTTEDTLDILLGQPYPVMSGIAHQNLPLVDGNTYTVFYVISKVNQWKFIMGVSNASIVERLAYIKLFAVFFSLLSLLIGLVLSFKLTSKNYKPIEALINLVKSKLFHDVEPQANEYAFLEKALSIVFEYKEKSDQEVSFFRPFLRNACLTQLLLNKIDNASTSNRLFELINVTFNNTYFTCYSILLNTGCILSGSMQDAINQLFMQYNALAYLVDVNEKSKIVILNTPSSSISQYAGIIREFLSSWSMDFKVIGVGKTYSHLENIRSSYHEALTAAEYRFVSKNSEIIYFDNVAEFVDTSYDYPIEKEQHLFNFVRSCESEKALAVINDVVSRNLNDKQLPLAAVRHLFYSLAITMIKALEDHNIPSSLSIDSFLYLDSLEDMTANLESLCKDICTIISREKESNNKQLLNEVIRYIETNYSNRNMSLSFVSGEFSISPGYLSRFIKNQTGTNFVDYLNKLRIEASKPLLGMGLTILEVAQRVGFDNDTNYRRLFKKYEGLTPGQYKIS